MITLPLISGYAAAFLGIMQVALMLTVGLTRTSSGISLGDGGDENLLRKIRRHGNLTENAPIFLILLGFLEISGGPQMAVIGFAALFVVARISHAFALSSANAPLIARAIGALGTIIGIAGTAGTLVWYLSSMQ